MSHHKKLDRKTGGGSTGGSWGGGAFKAMVGGCCVCSEEQGWDENPLVYCDGDGCSVAVHKHCYGIIKVPAGSWFCRLDDIRDLHLNEIGDLHDFLEFAKWRRRLFIEASPRTDNDASEILHRLKGRG